MPRRRWPRRGVPRTEHEARLRERQRFFGSASFGQPEGIEVFVCAQTGAQAAAVPWMELSRGMAREQVNELGSGSATRPTRRRSGPSTGSGAANSDRSDQG